MKILRYLDIRFDYIMVATEESKRCNNHWWTYYLFTSLWIKNRKEDKRINEIIYFKQEKVKGEKTQKC